MFRGRVFRRAGRGGEGSATPPKEADGGTRLGEGGRR
jgi:hypothetical protein